MFENDADRLESWKEIAAAIRRDQRTAYRWAKDRGMPVHHVPGGNGRVFASRAEILRWLEGSRGAAAAEGFAADRDRLQVVDSQVPESNAVAVASSGVTGVEVTTQLVSTPLVHRQPVENPKAPAATAAGSVTAPPHPPNAGVRGPQLLRVLLLIAASLLVCGILLYRYFRIHAAEPASVTFTADAVHALDSAGREIWQYKFRWPVDTALFDYRPWSDFVRVADLRGDGHKEVLVVVPYRLGPNPEDTIREEVDCISAAGKLLWSYVPENKFQFGTHQILGPYVILDLLVSSEGRRPAIFISASGDVWGNSFVAQLDPVSGHATLRFVNTGLIFRLRELKTNHATYMLAAGFNNEWDGGSLAIWDERRPFVASPQTEGTRHKCDSCPAGVPDYYLVFPRSEINRYENVYPNFVRGLAVEGRDIRDIQVTKNELDNPGSTATIYLLRMASGIEPISLRYDSGYDMLHRQLSAEHKLDHSLENCPERLHPLPVKMWTPSAGWSELHFPGARADE